MFAINTYGDNTKSGATYYGESSTRPDTIAIGLEFFGKTHLTRCTGKKREDLQDNNKQKIDHIPLCLMINLPKVESIKTDSKTYSTRDMNMSFQNEDWRAKWFDHKYVEQINGIDFKEAIETQGDVHFAYGQLEFIMQETATEIWPITTDIKKEEVMKEEKKFNETCQSLKHKWWTEWTNKRLAAIKTCTEIKKKIENRADYLIFNIFMNCGQPSPNKEDAINTYILLKDGRAFENQEALKTTFQVWLPLVRYLKYNRMVAHEATIKRNKNQKRKN